DSFPLSLPTSTPTTAVPTPTPGPNPSPTPSVPPASPTPTPSPTPPIVSGLLANECATPGAGWIWCDDFEQNRLSSYFEYDDANGRFARTASGGVDGTYGMRALFNQGDVGAGSLHLAFGRTPQSYIRPVDAGTANYREVYWRMYLRHQEGWTGG